jgi:crotonobetainyl-CoA:carnitine CoA-transferase CaiB-like acyl-CoA transferase
MQPLFGINVIEASSYVSGPTAALNLADLGAKVLKIEPPTGDPMRHFGVCFEGMSYSFAACNVGKTSATLDLKRSQDQRQFHQLLSDADVLITNWRPSVAGSLGLSAKSIASMYPRLVWARISGYGQSGPLADRPAFDGIVQARTGIALARERDAELVPGYLADKVTGVFAAESIIAALYQRSVTNVGAVVDVAMLDAMAYFNGPDLFAGGIREEGFEPDVMRHISAARPLATKDGWILVSPVSGRQLKGLLVAVGHPEWVAELRTLGDALTILNELNRLIAPVLLERTSAEWEEIFRDADVPASAVFSIQQHFEDVQVEHNRLYRHLDDPHLGPIRRLRFPVLFNESPVTTDDLAVPPLEPVAGAFDQGTV